MLAALLLHVSSSGASSHDGWLRQHYRARALKKDYARIAAELKELYAQHPSAQANKVLEPFRKGEQIRWLTLAADPQAIEALLAAMEAQRMLLHRQRRLYEDAEAVAILEMADAQDREILRRGFLLLSETLH